MAKLTSVAVPAKVLTPYETGLIRRKAIIKAAMTRLEKLEKQINGRLYPAIDAELKAQGEDTKATVAVKSSIVEVKHSTANMPRYGEVLKQFLGEDELADMLATTDASGTFVYQTVSDRYAAKLIGRNATFEEILS